MQIVDGELDCTLKRPKVEPFRVVAEDLDYRASDLRPGQRGFGAWGYLSHADLNADLRVGETNVTLEQQFADTPRVMRIGNVNLGQIDRLGSQKDAIVFKRGKLDFVYTDRGDEFEVDARLTGLELEKNEEAEFPDFLFMSVDRVIAHVEENGGSLELQFTRAKGATEASDDLEFVMAEVWRGMWVEIMKRFQAEAGEELKDWKAKGTEKLRGFLRNKDLLKKEEDAP